MHRCNTISIIHLLVMNFLDCYLHLYTSIAQYRLVVCVCFNNPSYAHFWHLFTYSGS